LSSSRICAAISVPLMIFALIMNPPYAGFRL
jgi:hypothetical protein